MITVRFLPVVVFLGMLNSMWAQPIFQLTNKSASDGLDAPILDWTGSRLSGTDWRVEVYGGLDSGSLTPLVARYDPSQRYITTFPFPGYFKADTPAGPASVASVQGGGWVWLQVKVWDVRLGATYEAVSSKALGGYGQSEPFYARGGNADALEVPQPLLGLQSFSVLQPVPEPSTYALLLTGGGSLCWLCRRRT